ncbi:MAG TPA: acetolactate synthase small subunit [Planctomycetota bacterium]|nr:acetolactate synthase small subunit [Planctomycetota bacterium]
MTEPHEGYRTHIISATVANRPGVLARVAGLFSSRGYNIDSLAVGETETPETSRMTIAVHGDEAVLEQIRKQLGKVIDVLKVQDFQGRDYVQRDLMLIKVSAAPAKRGEIFQLCEVFEGKVVDISPRHVTLEITGPENKVDAFITLMRPYGIREVARTGRIAMLRGTRDGK